MKIQIVAELAQGFEGRPEQARLLLRAAAAAGADAAKFQLVYADELATPDYKYYGLFHSLEMPDNVWAELASYAVEQGIELHLDIFGSRSLALAEKVGATAIKLHGTDIANLGLLDEVAQSSVQRVFLGAGGAHLSEIEEAVLRLSGKKVVVLLGFQGYPTPTETNQIARIGFLRERFHGAGTAVELGFADHASPDSPLRYALAAIALGAGATVIEKHLTLGKAMMLEDHEAALNPDEFKEFSQVVRDCSSAFGEAKDSDDFGMTEAEIAYRKMIRRHVVTASCIPEGTVLTPADLVLKRTAAEQPITSLNDVYQKVTCRTLVPNQALLADDIKS
jgi:N,N'-diacetyllegionaminate synthase